MHFQLKNYNTIINGHIICHKKKANEKLIKF